MGASCEALSSVRRSALGRGIFKVLWGEDYQGDTWGLGHADALITLGNA
jgi:hypothetical protein